MVSPQAAIPAAGPGEVGRDDGEPFIKTVPKKIVQLRLIQLADKQNSDQKEVTAIFKQDIPPSGHWTRSISAGLGRPEDPRAL